MSNKKCAKCIYGWNGSGDNGWYCDYLSIVGHRRPCKAGDECTEFKSVKEYKKQRTNPFTGVTTAPRRNSKIDALHDQVMKLYRDGKNDKEISEAVGMGRAAIRMWRERNGLPPIGGVFGNPEIDFDRIKALYDEGLVDEEIARKVGCDRRTVGKWRKKNGYKSNYAPPKAKPKIDISDDSFGEMLNWAVRYSIGRQTYAGSDTVSFIMPLVHWLSNKTLWCIERDIEEHDKYGIGEDEAIWMRLLQAVKKELENRKEKE